MNYACKLSFLLLLLSCSSDKNPKSDFQDNNQVLTSDEISFSSISKEHSGVQFKNQVIETADRNVTDYDYMYNGAGVAIADFDNDGLPDIFFCGNDAPNAIYRNKGKLSFQDKSATALPKHNKWAFGVTTVDINNDGFIDLYVSNSGPNKSEAQLSNQLLINNGDFTFTDQAKKYGLASASHSVQGEFFDYDNDGDLDLWLNNHGNAFDVNRHIKAQGYNDMRKGNRLDLLNRDNSPTVQKAKLQLFRNDGGTFTDVSNQAGVSNLAYGLGLSVADFNDDGFIDVYVANDYWVPDYYFINQGNGTFKQNNSVLDHTSYYSMGSDAGDYNNDGILDLVVVDMTPKDHYRNKTLMESMDVKKFTILSEVYKFPRQYMFNTFQLGIGKGQFSEIANSLEVSRTEWSWAPLLFDMNNNGHSDLYISNGYFRDTKNQDVRRKIAKMKSEMGTAYTQELDLKNLELFDSQAVANAIFKNNGKGDFQEASSSGQKANKSFSNGVAYGDLDNDGDLDLVINNFNSDAEILENKTSSSNYLKLKLVSNNQNLHKHAKVEIFHGDKIIRRDNNFTRGYLSAMEPLIHVGLGEAAVDSLIVTWRDGSSSKIFDLPKNQTLEIDYTTSNARKHSIKTPKQTFVDASVVMQKSQVVHKEEFYNDFDKEVLLPQKFSTLGPALASGDVDGDGFEDFFMGGSSGQRGKLMLMKGNSFVEASVSTFESDKSFEDLGALFFDANKDGLLDLYVASGGGGELQKDVFLMDRLYINSGGGNFQRSAKALPKISSSTKAIAAFDLEKDGDLDLFVGGRNLPGKYPSRATSYLLENEGGVFKKIEASGMLESLPNMVTDVAVADINQDGYTDLFITGEWSEAQVYYNNTKGSFDRADFPALKNLKGWWYSVSAADLDKDGQVDFVLGNLGTNNKFNSSKKNPLKLRYDDFDGNGSQDIVLTKNYKGKEVPVRGKECSSEQMPMLNSKFETYSSFASASITEILGEEKVNNSNTLSANYFNSAVLLSSNGKYELKELPLAAQHGPILDSEIIDLDRDGNLDIILAGKIVNTEPETPSYDANNGVILYGKGAGTFLAETNINKTGLNLKYNTKQISLCRRPNGFGLLVANNNGLTQLFVKR